MTMMKGNEISKFYSEHKLTNEKWFDRGCSCPLSTYSIDEYTTPIIFFPVNILTNIFIVFKTNDGEQS